MRYWHDGADLFVERVEGRVKVTGRFKDAAKRPRRAASMSDGDPEETEPSLVVECRRATQMNT